MTAAAQVYLEEKQLAKNITKNKGGFKEPKKPKKKMPTKRVFICSPFKADIKKNTKNAQMYCRFAFEQGYVPIAPHLYYPQFLDEFDDDERAIGIRYGLETMWQARELWVFGENISSGMRTEIELAKELKIRVRYFNYNMEEKI